MAYEFKMRRVVEFVDTDMAGIMHFSNFFRYMEMTEAAFIRSLGFSVFMNDPDKSMGMPRVHARCDYLSPLKFGDEFEIHLFVREKKTRVFSYDFVFTKLNATPPSIVARGSLTVVNVTLDAKENKFKAIPFPVGIADQIEIAPSA